MMDEVLRDNVDRLFRGQPITAPADFVKRLDAAVATLRAPRPREHVEPRPWRLVPPGIAAMGLVGILALILYQPASPPPVEPAEPAAPAGDETSVTVKTKDGDTIKGTIAIAGIKIKTGFGEVTVEIEKVASIEFGEQDVVTTKQKTTLKGRVLVDEFKVKADIGELSLKRESLASITMEGGAAPVDKGKMQVGTAKNGVTYHLRVPDKYDAKKGRPAIVVLHGSNMNSKDYVNTFVKAWPKIAEEYILLGVNGERKAKGSTDDSPAYNYTYVNFAGKSKYKGYAGTDRESPALVSEVVQEVKQRVAMTKIIVCGHSQGGYLTYSLFMNYPDLFAGAVPVSGGMIIQAEPSAYDKPEIRALQRKGAVAIVHGENDGVVDFELATAAYESYLDDAFAPARLFTDKSAAHMFAALPVEEAIRWVEAMTSNDPAGVADLAQRKLAAKEYRDAITAAQRAQELDAKKAHTSKIKGVLQQIDKLAAARAGALQKAIEAAKDDAWVEEFQQWRAQFEFTDAAKGAGAAYRKLREAHEKPAEDLWHAARKDFQKDNGDEGYKKYEEIVKKYFASSWYRYAKQALKDRK